MIPTQLLKYPEQLAKRLSDMEAKIAELERKIKKFETTQYWQLTIIKKTMPIFSAQA